MGPNDASAALLISRIYFIFTSLLFIEKEANGLSQICI